LAHQGLVTSTTKQLSQLGFRKVFMADGESAYQLAHSALEKVLKDSGYDPREIDVLIYASALPAPSVRRPRKPESLFRYPAAALQYDFGLIRANVLGVAQAGCVGLLSAIRLARDMIASEPGVNRALCVSSDVLPKGSHREILYNLISDGAAAVMVERNCARNRLLAYSQVSKGVYWESDNRRDEIVAAYFSSARAVIEDALKKARLSLSEIAMVLPHNVNRKSWEILGQLLEIPRDRLFWRNIAAKGHTIAADNVINLCDAARRGDIKPGDNLMMFSFGFGAHWACAIVQH
jgi:3-oxoacyl-[acyl-carrier-protein] synthase-3